MTFFVYECFAENGSLLYIGSTKSFGARLKAHSRSSSWYAKTSTVIIIEYKTISAAREAEYLLIDIKRPKYNKKKFKPIESKSNIVNKCDIKIKQLPVYAQMEFSKITQVKINLIAADTRRDYLISKECGVSCSVVKRIRNT